MEMIRKSVFESFQGAKFNTLLLVHCNVQVCYGTVVEHMRLSADDLASNTTEVSSWLSSYHMVAGCTTTCAIGSYHHQRCDFESHSGGVYSIILYDKVISDLREVGSFLRVLRFPPSIKLTATIYLKYC